MRDINPAAAGTADLIDQFVARYSEFHSPAYSPPQFGGDGSPIVYVSSFWSDWHGDTRQTGHGPDVMGEALGRAGLPSTAILWHRVMPFATEQQRSGAVGRDHYSANDQAAAKNLLIAVLQHNAARGSQGVVTGGAKARGAVTWAKDRGNITGLRLFPTINHHARDSTEKIVSEMSETFAAAYKYACPLEWAMAARAARELED